MKKSLKKLFTLTIVGLLSFTGVTASVQPVGFVMPTPNGDHQPSYDDFMDDVRNYNDYCNGIQNKTIIIGGGLVSYDIYYTEVDNLYSSIFHDGETPEQFLCSLEPAPDDFRLIEHTHFIYRIGTGLNGTVKGQLYDDYFRDLNPGEVIYGRYVNGVFIPVLITGCWNIIRSPLPNDYRRTPSPDGIEEGGGQQVVTDEDGNVIIINNNNVVVTGGSAGCDPYIDPNYGMGGSCSFGLSFQLGYQQSYCPQPYYYDYGYQQPSMPSSYYAPTYNYYVDNSDNSQTVIDQSNSNNSDDDITINRPGGNGNGGGNNNGGGTGIHDVPNANVPDPDTDLDGHADYGVGDLDGDGDTDLDDWHAAGSPSWDGAGGGIAGGGGGSTTGGGSTSGGGYGDVPGRHAATTGKEKGGKDKTDVKSQEDVFASLQQKGLNQEKANKNGGNVTPSVTGKDAHKAFGADKSATSSVSASKDADKGVKVIKAGEGKEPAPSKNHDYSPSTGGYDMASLMKDEKEAAPAKNVEVQKADTKIKSGDAQISGTDRTKDASSVNADKTYAAKDVKNTQQKSYDYESKQKADQSKKAAVKTAPKNSSYGTSAAHSTSGNQKKNEVKRTNGNVRTQQGSQSGNGKVTYNTGAGGQQKRYKQPVAYQNNKKASVQSRNNGSHIKTNSSYRNSRSVSSNRNAGNNFRPSNSGGNHFRGGSVGKKQGR